jgi:hypothetical protein
MRLVLGALWLLFTLLAIASGAAYVRGILRDLRAGEPRIGLSLAAGSVWHTDHFRVWRPRRYELLLSSVNHVPPFGIAYQGSLEVRVVDPSERTVLDERYEAGATDHERPRNMTWTTLATVDLRATGWRRWTLTARVPEGDARFVDVRSTVSLRRVRQEPGMGGMVNYVMIVPALGFAMLSLLPALALVNRGDSRIPLWISGVLVAGMVALLVRRP